MLSNIPWERALGAFGDRPAGAPVAYVTDFPGQGPTARVLYRSLGGHVHELYYVASTAQWGEADLTALTGAPPAGHVTAAYVTDAPGQGPTARVVYLGMDRHLHELYYIASAPAWAEADLTALTGGAAAAGPPIAYVTDFPDQGLTARLVYRSTDDHVRELYYVASAGQWGEADLTALTGAAAARGAPSAYVTDFPGQGPTARVVYVGTDGHMHELYYIASAARWDDADLTSLTG